MQLRGLQQREGPPLPAVAAGTSSAGGRTVALQILMARGLPASDLNGMSDPYWCPPPPRRRLVTLQFQQSLLQLVPAHRARAACHAVGDGPLLR